MEKAETVLTRLKELLRIEYEEEKQTFGRLVDRVGASRLEARGRAWTGISFGRTYFNSLNQRVVEVFRPSGHEDEDHEFEYGRPVSFFTEDSLSGKVTMNVAGMVNFVDGDRMVVAVADSADIASLSSSRAGIMLSLDETTYRAMNDAIDRTLRADGRLGELRDLIYSPRPVGFLNFAPLGFPYLNKSQEEAVNKVLRAKDVAVVHGPPGTGKTTTLVEAIQATLMREPQVLVCAQSNMAVDWISEKLTERGINVLRVGNPSRVTDRMLASTYERRFEAHSDYPLLWQVRKNIRELQASRRRGSSEAYHQKIARLKSRAVELELRINNDLFSEARVVASTLVGSGNRVLDGRRFSTLFVDEAAQALEAATLIPLRKVSRVVLAGDHCQLPPTVKSFEAAKAGLGLSLMERIVRLHPEAVTLLREQYRMREEIMHFPNLWFYDGRMKAAPEVRWRGILDYDTAVEWVDTSEIPLADDADETDLFREMTAGEGFGRVNRAEARLALEVLEAYITRIGGRRILDEKIDFGLISPYRAQVRYLRSLLRQTKFFRPFRSLISINTVDGFQGQERDVIMVSTVRSNDEGQIGFLRDLRRMNVAITRARMKLIIVGDVPTLSRHRFFRLLHNYVETL